MLFPEAEIGVISPTARPCRAQWLFAAFQTSGPATAHAAIMPPSASPVTRGAQPANARAATAAIVRT